ncbi:hypothetical protein OHS71_39295 [Streptomyces sp. NBC_00377]|nr:MULTISPECIES: hypothetical protein [unclassified Streptomyces]
MRRRPTGHGNLLAALDGPVVRLATLDADGPTGTFQDENGDVPW